MEKTNIWKLIFKEWMKNRCCWKAFKAEVSKDIKTPFESYEFPKSPHDFVSVAFFWCESKNGHNFWNGIHEDWIIFVENFRKATISNYGGLTLEQFLYQANDDFSNVCIMKEKEQYFIPSVITKKDFIKLGIREGFKDLVHFQIKN